MVILEKIDELHIYTSSPMGRIDVVVPACTHIRHDCVVDKDRAILLHDVTCWILE